MLETQPLLFQPDTRMPRTVSKRAFAEIIAVTPGRVSQMITAGLPVEPNGRIDVERGRRWVSDNVDQNRRRATVEPADSPSAFDGPLTARGRRDVSEAEISRLKAERLGGRLIDRKATLRAVEGCARFERDGWIGWVNRAAPLIAAEAGGDLARVVATLDREVRAHLAALADKPLELPK